MKKSVKRLLTTLVLFVMALVGVFAIGCSDDKDNKKKPSTPAVKDPVVYYCELNGDEYILNLNNKAFTLIVSGSVRAGTSSEKDGVYTLKFSDVKNETTTATENENGTLSLVYNNATLSMYKRVQYTVTYNSHDGSSVAAEKILNGKTVDKPADPTRDGYTFIGWYADSAYSKPYAFGTDIVTNDLTLHAQWVKKVVGQNEYTVKFDLNYENAPALESKQTESGKLFDVATPTRSGYNFVGWWASMTGNKAELAYKLESDTVFQENTTLYALWQKTGESKLATPVVNVKGNNIEWAAVGNTVSGYEVAVYNVTDPKNAVRLSGATVTEPKYTFDFAAAAAGDYRVEVTAKSSGGTSLDSEKAIRVYRNKGLARVSLFSVIEPSVLLFNQVDNAATYEIDVKCGNPDHNHNPFNNGSSNNYNFINCDMPQNAEKSGITFTVTAKAEGYMPSTSEPYSYRRLLEAVDAVTVDESTETAKWNAVAGATNYIVSIKAKNSTSATVIDNGSKTSVSLREFADGELTINVYPSTKGYYSPAATQYVYNKQSLAAPAGLTLTGNVLSWTSTGADKYYVSVAGKQITVTGATSLDLSKQDISWKNGEDYKITVKAEKGGKQSLESTAVDARYYAMHSALSYNKNTVSWRYVIGADSYDVRVNGGKVINVEGKNSAKVELTKSGDNLIEVRYNDGGIHSDWAPMHVTAYALGYDGQGATGKAATKYYAHGDIVELDEGESLALTGHHLDGWYTAPGGAASNGAKYVNGAIYDATGNVTLYANWKPNKYTLTLDFNRLGSSKTTKVEVIYGQKFNVNDLPVPDDAINAFNGWYSTPYALEDDIRYTDERGNGLSAWTLPRDGVIYAGWISVFSFAKSGEGNNAFYTIRQGQYSRQITTINVPAVYQGPGDDKAYPVKAVSDTTFWRCTSLVEIHIPQTVTFIDYQAFQNCAYLEKIVIDPVEGAGNEYVYETKDGVLLYNNEITGQKDLWFYPRGKVEANGVYKIPDGVNNIPSKYAFYYSKFSEVVIPASMESVSDTAFYYTNNLTKVEFVDGTGAATDAEGITIYTGAFRYAPNLEEVVFPTRCETFNRDMLYGCNNIKKVSYQTEAKYKTTDYNMLYEVETSTLLYCPPAVQGNNGNLTIPNVVRVIGERAFSGCTKIKNVTIPNHVTEIGKQAFSGYYTNVGTTRTTVNGCYNLRSVRFVGGGNENLTIGESAFGRPEGDPNQYMYCKDLDTVTFDANCTVSEIGTRAFSGCSFVSIQLPNSVTSLGQYAFANCKELLNFRFAETAENVEIDPTKSLTVGANCFDSCYKLTNIKLPYYLSAFPATVFAGCSKLAVVEVDERNPNLKSADGVLYSGDWSELIYYPAGKTGKFTMPEQVTTIAANSFAGRTNLSEVVIGKNVTNIGNNAFAGSSVTKVTFATGRDPSANITLGTNVFQNCSRLGTFEFPATGITSISDNMFNGCTQLKEIEIPKSVATIGHQAFYNCSKLDTLTFANRATTTTEEVEGENGETTNQTTTTYASLAMVNSSGSATTTSAVSTFYGCTSLLEVILPMGLTNIGHSAFSGCSKLQSISIPSTVTNVYAAAFYNCVKLSTVTFDNNNSLTFADGSSSTPGVFANTKELTSISLPASVKRISNYMFCGSGLATASLGEGVEQVGDYAYSNCASLTSVTFPGTLKNDGNTFAIGQYAFQNCEILNSVGFNGETTDASNKIAIGANAFNGCSSLQVLNLPAARIANTDNANAIPNVNVFANCTSLTAINFVEGCNNSGSTPADPAAPASGTGFKSLDGMLVSYTVSDGKTTLMYCPLAKSGTVTIPYEIDTIADSAFRGNSAMTTLTIANKPENDESETIKALTVGTTANPSSTTAVFASCTALTTVNLNARITAIKRYMFYGCTSLTAVNFNDSAPTAIQQYAFKDTTSLTRINLPTSVTSIEQNAFENSRIGATVNGVAATVVIPENVTTIGNYAFYNNPEMTSVSIPKKVTSVGTNAFQNNSKLSSVTFGSVGDSTYTTGMTIGQQAFENCTGLQNITIPHNVTSIGISAFNNDVNLTTVTIEGASDGTSKLTTISATAFQYTKISTMNVPASVTSIGSNAFSYCYHLDSIALPSRLTSLPAAFVDCFNLKNITVNSAAGVDAKLIVNDNVVYTNSGATLASYPRGKQDTVFYVPKNVTAISAGAFSFNSNLQTIYIPLTVASIPNEAFAQCTALTAVVVGDYSNDDLQADEALTTEQKAYYAGITKAPEVSSFTVGEKAFAGCSSLRSVTLPQTLSGTLGKYAFASTGSLQEVIINGTPTVSKIDDYAFYYSGIQTFTIPSSITNIGQYAFQYSGLTSVTIPNKVTTLGTYAFAYSKLQEVEFAANDDSSSTSKISTMGNYAFYNCKQLQTVTLNRVANTGTYAFAESGVQTVVFNGSLLTTIGNYAFYNCKSLTTANLPTVGLTTISQEAFRYAALNAVTIPNTVTSLGKQAFANGSIVTVTFATGSSGNITTVNDGIFMDNKSLTTVTLARLARMAGSSSTGGMFDGCSLLNSVTFADNNLVTIGISAFEDCTSLKTISIPDSVGTIDARAFAGCTNLQTVTLSRESNLGTINTNAFTHTTALSTIALPSKLATIGATAFEESGLVSIVIPTSVTTLNNSAFRNSKKLQEVKFAEGSNLYAFKGSLNDGMFMGCEALQRVTLPGGLKTLDSHAFDGCKQLNSITLPGTLTAVSSYAFSGCENLQTVTFNKGTNGNYEITLIDDYAFAGTALTSVSIPYTVKTIGVQAFAGANINSLIFMEREGAGAANDLTTIKDRAFSGNNLKAVALPDGLTTLGKNPFEYNSGLVLTISDDHPAYKIQDGMLFSADMSVLYIGSGAKGYVDIPSSVAEIKEYAFAGSLLTSLRTPDQEGFMVGTYAFVDATALESIQLGSKADIKANAFEGNTSLKSVTLGEVSTLGAQAFKDCTALTQINIPFGTEIGSGIFDGCTALADYTYSDTVFVGGFAAEVDAENNTMTVRIASDVAANQFKNNTSITSVIIEEGVKAIGNSAFEGCTNLVSVQLPLSLTSLGTGSYGCVFANCTSLTTVNIKDTAVTVIAGRTFLGCSSLSELELHEGITSIEAFAFTGSGIENLVIPASVSSLSEIFRPQNGLVGDKIKTVTFAEGSKVTTIKSWTFQNSSVESVVLPQGLTTISYEAFIDSSIKNITIPANVTTISYKAFMNCANLETVTFAEGSKLTTLAHSAFKNSGIETISLPATLKTMNYDYTSGDGNDDDEDIPRTGPFANCYRLKSVEFQVKEDGTSALTKINKFAFQDSALQSVVIPKSVTSIDESAFDGCKNLSDLTFAAVEAGVTSQITISGKAFANTAIESIVLPYGTKSITTSSNNPFTGAKLKQITLPAKSDFGCTGTSATSNFSIFMNMTSLEKVIIPEGMTTIGYDMFSGCTSIKEIIIPASVTVIRDRAFNGWTAEQTIKMTGKPGISSAWTSAWNVGCNANIVWNYTPATDLTQAA